MVRILFKSILFVILLPINSIAQIENVIVETYYISDAIDATDTTGGILTIGSKTYRVFVDLAPGSRLKKIYGDTNHALKFSSTAPFFNNKMDGQSFAKDFSKTRLQENTVALDSWLTLGQATRVAAKTYFGVVKSNDLNGSFIGGVNNDGGSAGISSGLLANADVNAGIPITTADGLDSMSDIPSSWADYGFINNISGVDSSIFGSIKRGVEFISYNAGLQNSGVRGIDPGSNLVLVAQLTTAGEISFELNLEVEELSGGTTRVIKYVANSSTLLSDERLCPFLKFPALCGCTDPHYFEFNPAYSCGSSDSCKNLIVFGCTDTLACNYNSEANYNIPELCCYPGLCNDRDINVVCPQLSAQKTISESFVLYPNPATEEIIISGNTLMSGEVSIIIYDQYGKAVREERKNVDAGNIYQQLNVSDFSSGIYFLKLETEGASISRKFFIYK